MSMEVILSCAMCGREKKAQVSLCGADPAKLAAQTVADIAREARFIVQINGDNVDLYCSKRCAK